MTRRRRHTVAAMLGGLAGLAAVVHADGGWALWGQTMDPWNAIVVLPLGAWPTRGQCETEKARREQAPEELRMAGYTCLPDTVDPRTRAPGAGGKPGPGGSGPGDGSGPGRGGERS